MQQGYRSRGSGQPQKRRFPRFSRPHSFHQPKECAGSRKEKERNQRSAPAAERKKRGRTGGPALVCPQREPTKGVRRQQKGSKKAGRAGRDRASALKTVPCRCLSAFPGRTRLPTASTNQRSAPAADRKKRGRWTRSCSCCIAPWGPIAFYFLYFLYFLLTN